MNKIWIAPLVGVLSLYATHALAQEILLHNADSLEGASLRLGSQLPESRLELNDDGRYISEGTGSIHARSVMPSDAQGNGYVSFILDVKPFRMAEKGLVFDAWSSKPDTTHAFYVRGTNADGRHVLSWLSWYSPLSSEKQTFILLPEKSSGVLSWEQAKVDAPNNEVVRLEFIAGSRKPGAPFNLFIDNIRLDAANTRSVYAITQAAPLYPNTTIIENGEAQAIIVTPDDRDWQALGEELAQAIAEVSGCSPAVKTASELGDEDLYEINAIVLGSIVNNRRLLYSYSHSQLFADDYYPGSSGYDVRSIHDPWGTAKNIISIGASDIEGARAGVAALIKKFGDGGSRLVIPRILEVHLTGEAQRREGRHFTAELGDEYIEQQKNEAESGLKAGIHTGLFGQARKVGALYALTRKPDYARVFVWLIRRAKAHYDTKPGTYGGPWGMDSDFAIYSVMPAWDEVEEDPSLTDQDRLDVSRILFDWVSEVGVAGRARGPKVRYNHQTFPALGLTYAGHYFAKHYQVIEAHQWLNIAANTFAVQIDTDKAHCDCNAYQWLTLYHTILYSLATQNLKYFENGNMRRNAEYAIHTMNNLGFQVAYGDIGHWGIIGTESYILQIAEWYYRDGRARWVFDKKMAIRNLTATSQYRTCQVEPVSPEDLSGATVWPLAELWYESFLDESGIPFDRTVDKIIFREGFDPNDQYLLLDGLSISGHGHKDGNSILAWSQNNRVWLTDGDYIKALPKFHNGVLVLRDGQSATIPPAVELVSFSDLPSTAVSRTVKCNYAGADWMRNIVWLKGRAFLVLDHMEAKTDGEFSFRAVWQTIGEVDHQGSVLDINQKGQFARFAMTDDISTLLHDDPALGKNWVAYPHAIEPIIRVFQGVLAQDMKQGDTAYLFTALHASGDKPSPAGLRRVAPNAAVFTGDGEPVLLVSPSPTHREVLPGLIQGDAELFVVSPSRLVAVGATRLDVQGVTQTFPIPTDVEIDFCSHTRTQMPTRRSANKAPESPIQDAVPVSVTAAALFKAIDDLLAKTADSAKAEVSGPSAPAVAQLWQFSTEATELGRLDSFTRLDAADIDADGSDEIFAGAESGYVYCLNSDGSLRWSFNTQAAVSDLATVDFLGDGQRWVVAGGPGGKVFGIDHDGKERWTCQIPFYKRAGHVRVIFPADLAGEGRQVAIVGAENWHYYALDASGSHIWQYESVHPSTAGTAADLDGDGKEELALGTAYYWWHLINPDGSRRWQYSTLGGPGVTAVAAGDITGNGVPEVLFGGEDSFVQTVDAGGKSVWMFNTGDEITGLAVVRLEEAEPIRVFVSSLSFNVYSLDGQGKLVWRRDLGSPVRSMAVHEQGGHLAAACDNGVFYMLNPRGEVVGMFDNAGRIRDIVPTRLNGKTAFITASDNGYLRAMRVE